MPYLVRSGPKYSYIGATHEYLRADPQLSKSNPLRSLWVEHIGNGGSKADKYPRDRRLLESEILAGRDSSRNHFYLAQTYEGLELVDLALKHYDISFTKSHWDEERYVSALRSGRLYLKLDQPKKALSEFLRSHECCPDRPEALYETIKVLKTMKFFSMAHRILKAPSFAPKNRVLFREPWIESWGLDIEAGVVAWRVGHKSEAREIFERVLRTSNLPRDTEALVRKNLTYC